MARLLSLLVGAVLLFAASVPAKAASEIVVAIRYLQAQGTSHAHLFLYRDDGKLLRKLTSDDRGQDTDPIFSADGETIVFTRELSETQREYWSIAPGGGGLRRLEAAPDWYTAAKSSPFFIGADAPDTEPSPGAAPPPPVVHAPDGSVELVLRTVATDEDDSGNGEGHGKHFLLRDLKAGKETEMGKLPGFLGLYDVLQLRGNETQRFLFEGEMRVTFFGLHLNSTDGSTVFALDLPNRRLVRLSPNYAAPFPLPGEPAFLTWTENRYVPIPRSTKTANCSYIERWDAQLAKIRYAEPKAAAICYGASMYRAGKTPPVITIRKGAE